MFGFGKRSADGPALSRQDYEHTTGDSPDSTAMIPPIREAAAPPAPAPSPMPIRRSRTDVRVRRIDPYSVTRLAFVVSVSLMIVTTVAVALFWLALSVTGVWDEINEAVATLLSDDAASFDITNYLGFTRMVGSTLVLSGINVVLMTALATVGAHLYNLASVLLGGVEVTLTED